MPSLQIIFIYCLAFTINIFSIFPFSSFPPFLPVVHAQETPDKAASFQKWLVAENTMNVPAFCRSSLEFATVKSAAIPADQVVVDFHPMTADFIRSFFIKEDKVIMPVQPCAYIDDETEPLSPPIPAYDLVHTPGLLPPEFISTHMAHHTASRSMVFYSPEGRPFSIKMGTNFLRHPKDPTFSNYDHSMREKHDLRKSVKISRNRTNHILETNAKIAPEYHLPLLLDMGSIALKETGNGIVIRDISALTNGHVFIPAFALPIVGRSYGAEIGDVRDFASFWDLEFARKLGEYKAMLLLVYGLQFKTPNAQNTLLEEIPAASDEESVHFKIHMRDLSDTSFMSPIMQAIDPENTWYKDDLTNGIQTHSYPYTFWRNSSWRMNSMGAKSFLPTVLNGWGRAHVDSYLKTINKHLGVEIKPVNRYVLEGEELAESWKNQFWYREKLEMQCLEGIVDETFDELEHMYPIYNFLISPEGQDALKKFHAKIALKKEG